MDFTFRYVSAACPELLESEVKIVCEHLNSDARYSALSAHGVRGEAAKMFPSVAISARYLDGRDKIESAIRHLTAATQDINQMPVLSDDMAMIDLDIKMSITLLKDNLEKIRGIKNV